MKRINSKYIDTGIRWLQDHSLIINEDGRIEKLCPQHEADRLPYRYEEENDFELLIPGCVNAHSHAFQVLLRPTTGQPHNFADWVDRFLYPLVLTLDEESLYGSALLAFTEMMRGGITTVGEFFYVHNLEDGSSSRQRNVHAVIQAARDAGIRMVLIRALYDRGEKEGQKRFKESADQALQQTEELAQHYANNHMVNVLPAPHSLHGASRELIEGAAQLAQKLKTPWHIHLSEQQSDIPFAEKEYGKRPVHCLEEWGVLSERTTLVHGIWLDASERQLLGQHRASLVYNPVTNMALGDGTGPIPELWEQGVNVALGSDANLISELFSEARSSEYLQRNRHLAMGCLPQVRSLFQMLNRNGGRVLGQPIGTLEEGHCADFLAINPESPSLLPALWEKNQEVALLNQIIYSMVPQSSIDAVYVDGRCRVRDGQHLSVPPQRLREALEKRTPRTI